MQICRGCGRTVADRAPCMSCPAEPEEHRGSRMPNLIREAAVDPLFAHAVFNEFTPEEKEMVAEKMPDRARRAGL